MQTVATPPRRRGRPATVTRRLADDHFDEQVQVDDLRRATERRRGLTTDAMRMLADVCAAYSLTREAQRAAQPYYEAGLIVEACNAA